MAIEHSCTVYIKIQSVITLLLLKMYKIKDKATRNMVEIILSLGACEVYHL